MAAQVVHKLVAKPWGTKCGVPVADPAGQYVTMDAASGFVNCPTCLGAH